MSETTAEYRVKNRNRKMNNNTRNEFASYGLKILKRSVLLVLYESTGVVVVDERSIYPTGHLLMAGQIREKLDLMQPLPVCANVNSLIHGILDYLRHDGLAHHIVGVGWGITEDGVKVIEGE